MNVSADVSGAFDGLGIAELVRSGQISALDVAKDAIRRIERVNPHLNAIAETVYEQGLEAAAQPVDPDAPFCGVPVVTKDLFQPLQGAQMTNGALTGKGAPPMSFDAEVVTRARAAGCSILATTTSPEFGTSFTTESRLFGATRNPWSLDHTSGGSSGGSAALVAARAIPFALGNDGGGSLRVPASCCGVFGFKPSRGRTPMGPAVGEGWAGMGINHVLSISVRDSAAALDAFAGEDIGAPYAAHDDETFLSATTKRPKGLRVGLVTALSPWTTEPQVREAIDETVELLEDLGHHVEETALPVDALEYYDLCFNIIGAQTRSLINFMGMMGGTPSTRACLKPARASSCAKRATSQARNMQRPSIISTRSVAGSAS